MRAGGGSPDAPCTICPAGTYSRGGDLEACKPCKFGYTSAVGSTSSKDCYPVDQCPAGTGTQPYLVLLSQHSTAAALPHMRQSVMFISVHSTALLGEPAMTAGRQHRLIALNVDSCLCVPQCAEVPTGAAGAVAATTQECRCKAGYGSPAGTGSCRLCPPGTYSTGGTMEDCKPCAFGRTSKAGAASAEECVEAAQACPVGQIAVGDAVSEQQCACLPGYGGTLLLLCDTSADVETCQALHSMSYAQLAAVAC